MMIKYFKIVMLSISFLSCSSTEFANSRRTATKLNNCAVNIMHDAFIKNDSTVMDSMLKQSLKLLSKSIDVDSSYVLAASNKSALEFKMGRYINAVSTIKKIERNCDEDIPELKLLLGLCYLKTDNAQSARLALQDASNGFIKRQDTLNFYVAKSLFKGKDVVLAEIDTVPSLMNIRKYIEIIDFNNIDELFK